MALEVLWSKHRSELGLDIEGSTATKGIGSLYTCTFNASVSAHTPSYRAGQVQAKGNLETNESRQDRVVRKRPIYHTRRVRIERGPPCKQNFDIQIGELRAKLRVHKTKFMLGCH
jgi:hypothetical protein